MRVLAWVDGVNSALMTYIAIQQNPDVIPVHCDLGTSVHEDSHRFIDDLEKLYGKPIIRIRSEKYQTIDDVFDHRNYLSGINGAPCTGEMKIVPRMNFQLPSDMHLWGYTSDKSDAVRFDRMKENFPQLRQRSPLIEMGITKSDCHAVLAELGIKRPIVYDIGMPNGNCLGCVKATSPNYWALIRQWFPDVFERRSKQSRRLNVKLTRIKGKRVFIDEIPQDWPTTVRGNFGGCGFHCDGDQK